VVGLFILDAPLVLAARYDLNTLPFYQERLTKKPLVKILYYLLH